MKEYIINNKQTCAVCKVLYACIGGLYYDINVKFGQSNIYHKEHGIEPYFLIQNL